MENQAHHVTFKLSTAVKQVLFMKDQLLNMDCSLRQEQYFSVSASLACHFFCLMHLSDTFLSDWKLEILTILTKYRFSKFLFLIFCLF